LLVRLAVKEFVEDGSEHRVIADCREQSHARFQLQVVDGVESRRAAAPESSDLREHEPHPVTALFAELHFRQRTAVSAFLRLEESIELLHYLSFLHKKTDSLPKTQRNVSHFFSA
jgi:hypothetical protein